MTEPLLTKVIQCAWGEHEALVESESPGTARSALLKVSQETNLSGNLTFLIRAALQED